MPIHLSTAYGCFQAATAELSRSIKDSVARKA